MPTAYDDYLHRSRTSATKPANRGGARAIIGAALAAFLLGAALTGWLAYRSSGVFQTLVTTEEPADPAPSPEPANPGAPLPTPSASASQMAQAKQAAKAVEKVAEQQGGLDQRLAAAEQRLARLDLQSQAAAGNAARAEGLLIAFATRRALERGAELGYLADQLRLRFGDSQPNAVQTVINTSRDPVTLDQLIARLEGLGPQLSQTPSDEGALQKIRRELGSLFIVRRESAPSPLPTRRLDRARLFLESGRVEAAVAEVQNLPNAAEAGAWIKDAERYAAAQRALDLIETAAVLEPRRLRDGSGDAIEQMSPAGIGRVN